MSFIFRPLVRKMKSSVRYISPYYFEMPKVYKESIYLANAPYFDTINWYYFQAVEIAFDKFVKGIKVIQPTLLETVAINTVVSQINVLEHCDNILEIYIPLLKESGSMEMIKAYCAKHGMHCSIHLGGFRLSNDVKKADIKALAALSSYKHMCANVPFAGAYTGMKIDPSKYTNIELRNLMSSFIDVITQRNFFGPDINVIQAEQSYNPEILNHIIDGYVRHRGDAENILACVTGKLPEFGGIEDFNSVVAETILFGVEYFITNDDIMNKVNINKGYAGKKYILKGFGHVSMILVKLLKLREAICVGVCDENIGFYNPVGLNIDDIVAYKNNAGSLENLLPPYDPKKLLEEDCDMLIIFDSHKLLTCYTAPNIKAKIIVEATDGGITPSAHKIFMAKNKLVLPDLYINSGSSIASSQEYIRNTEYLDEIVSSSKMIFGDSELISSENTQVVPGNHLIKNMPVYLEAVVQYKMRETAKEIMCIMKEYNLNLDVRIAAYILAIEKIMMNFQSRRMGLPAINY